MRTLFRQILDDFQQMAHRTGQAVEPYDDKDVAGADIVDQPRTEQGGLEMLRIRAPGR